MEKLTKMSTNFNAGGNIESRPERAMYGLSCVDTPNSKGKHSGSTLRTFIAMAKIMAITVIITLLPFNANAQSSGTTIDMADNNPLTSGTGWTFDITTNVYTIGNGANVTVIGTNAEQRRLVVATNATAYITLNGVTIITIEDVIATGYNNISPLLLNSGADVTLTLVGTNTLTAGSWGHSAGIQTTDATIRINGAGSLTATGSQIYFGGAGIGGSCATNDDAYINDDGNLTIDYIMNINNGGTIIIDGGTVTAIGGDACAGIGGAYGSIGGTITINSGVVTATGNGGAGIGGGMGSPESDGAFGSGGVITINGGDVTATSNSGAGIGGGGLGPGGTITINNGDVTATGYTGIGAGASNYGASCGTITINGGNVTAIGAVGGVPFGAGIGGNTNSAGGKITITGGTVIASGYVNGAGIGGYQDGGSGNITITGGTVTATSEWGAGIGSGSNGDVGNITITGGTVTATSNRNALKYNLSAAIGGGSESNGAGGAITISGGFVTATNNIIELNLADNEHYPMGIGRNEETFTMNGNAVVFAAYIRDYNISRRTGGILFIGENAEGIFYGTNVTITDNVTIPNGYTLTIPEDKTLTIPAGRTLTNNGTVQGCGTIKRGGIYGAWTGNEPVPCIINYTLTVNNGTANGNQFADGAIVTITANEPPTGQQFKNWTATSAVTFADANSPTTTFTMPANAVTVTANFETITSYTVTVNNGTANSNQFATGATVTITANKPLDGQQFKNWTATPDVTFADTNSPMTTFTMPANAITVTAIFENITGNTEIYSSNPLKTWVHKGLLHVTGLTVGETVNIYNTMGLLVYKDISTSNEMEIPLPGKGVYIVRSEDHTVKVVYW